MPASRQSLRLFITAAGVELLVPLLLTIFPPSGNRLMAPVMALCILVLAAAGRIGSSYIVIGEERPDVPPMPKIVMAAVIASGLGMLGAMWTLAIVDSVATPLLLVTALALVPIHVRVYSGAARRGGLGTTAGWLVPVLQVGAVIGAATDRLAAAVTIGAVFIAVAVSTVSALDAHARASDDR